MPGPTKISITRETPDMTNALLPAVEAIKRGELVVFPTETVYGIAARADMPDAVQRIYDAKTRPPDKPLAFHIGSWRMLRRIAGALPDDVREALKEYWPGPVTFLLDVGGRKLGFRFPDHPVARSFLRACEMPVLATSANSSGAPSPINADMAASLAEHASYIIDAGPTSLAGDSTVVDLTVSPPQCLRRGVAEWRG